MRHGYPAPLGPAGEPFMEQPHDQPEQQQCAKRLRRGALRLSHGKQLGAVKIPSKTTAVPMTFMHEGQQYIVFATGSGTNTALVALSLRGSGGRGGRGGGGGGGQ